jgi:PIN domain nuclease of toxin-antitoxin system
MRLLLDTHIVIWSLSDPDKLSDEAKNLIEHADQRFVSAASIWEMSIKANLGKLKVNLDEITTALNDMGVIELPISWIHAKQVQKLARHHRDPFDHLILSQAICEPLILLTHDEVLAKYTDLVRLV